MKCVVTKTCRLPSQSCDAPVGVSMCRLCGNSQVPCLSSEDGVMASGFCETCSRLLKEFTVHLRRFCREFEQKLRDVFRELSQCNCFRITPERSFLRRTKELPSLHLLSGSTVVHFLCCKQHVGGKTPVQTLSVS